MLKMFITAGQYLLKSTAVITAFTKVAPIAAEYAIGAELVVAGTASATVVYFGVAVVIGAVAIWAINKIFELLSAYIDLEEAKVEETKAEEAKVEETKAEEAKVEETKVEEAKVEETKVEETKVEEAKAEAVVVEKVEVEEVAVSKNNSKKHSK